MTSTMYYASVPRKVRQIFTKENVNLPRGLLSNILGFMSRICSYEEEENKIRPSIIIGCNIDNAIKQVPGHYRLKVSRGMRSCIDIDKKVKPLVPFCNNGWHVYLDINPKYIEYGIVRAFTGLKGLSIAETLFTTDELLQSSVDFQLVELTAVNNFVISIRGLLGSELTIDTRFVKVPAVGDVQLDMAKDAASGVDGEDNRDAIVKVFYNLLKVALQKVHGTICLVVKKDYVFPNVNLKDGIWLEDPIDIKEFSLQHITSPGNITAEMFYALSGVMIGMMNHDGITVIDDVGRVRGYNIFISKESIKTVEVSGGARKRAAYALMQLHDPGVLGVYFQSQDGNSFYKRG